MTRVRAYRSSTGRARAARRHTIRRDIVRECQDAAAFARLLQLVRGWPTGSSQVARRVAQRRHAMRYAVALVVIV